MQALAIETWSLNQHIMVCDVMTALYGEESDETWNIVYDGRLITLFLDSRICTWFALKWPELCHKRESTCTE